MQIELNKICLLIRCELWKSSQGDSKDFVLRKWKNVLPFIEMWKVEWEHVVGVEWGKNQELCLGCVKFQMSIRHPKVEFLRKNIDDGF